MNSRQLQYRLLTLFSAAVIALLMAACSGETVYPRLLVDADSAYVNGDYALGDSLLDAYRQQKNQEGEAVGMYRRLVEVECDYFHDQLTIDHYTIVDSLIAYYEADSISDKYAKILLFMGDIFKNGHDYSAALDCFLKANTIVQNNDLTALYSLISRELGDIYFDQRMLDECITFYQRYLHLSAILHDTRRMAYAAFRMGRVHTINNNIDSTIYYYQKAIELGQQLPNDNSIISRSRQNLCDIYIQTEQYDQAEELLSRSSDDDYYWAYWHYGQNHADSAVYYFHRCLERYGWRGKVEITELLAQLETERGNSDAANEYYRQLAAAKDSLQAQSKVTEIMNSEKQFRLDNLRLERDRIAQDNKHLLRIVMVLAAVIAILICTGLLLRRLYKKKKEAENLRRERLIHELDMLRRQRQRQQAGAPSAKEAMRQQLSRLQEFQASDLYCRLKSNDPKAEKTMSTADWQELAESIDLVYNNFTDRLLSVVKLKEQDLHICYLIKIQTPPVEMATILYKSKAAITLARQRMYKKITGHDGKAEQLDKLILDF